MGRNHYLEGYLPPEGVDSRTKVREYQTMLGVTADGIWGPKTEAAYRAKSGGAATPQSMMADEVFMDYYYGILNSIQLPTVNVSTPDREELKADYEAVLRPSADLAISRRREAGERAKAEMDADAASRGMAASSYVSSMKEREGDDVENDVSMIEAQYGSALAERIAEALQYYAGLEAQAGMQNAQMAASASSSALTLASQWYLAYLDGMKETGSSSSSSSSGSERRGDLSPEEYTEYVESLTKYELMQLFNSGSAYWKGTREGLIASIGRNAYNALYAKYKPGFLGAAGAAGASSGMGGGGGGNGAWQAASR